MFALMVLAVLFAPARPVYADSIDYTVLKMKNELGLSQEQADSVKNIFRDRAKAQKEMLRDAEGEEITDQEQVNRVTKQLDEQQAKALAQVLDVDQMRKWSQKQSVRNRLNKDKVNFSDALATGSFTPGAASIQY